MHVVSVEAAGSAPVYDLTVEDQHEFFANGVLVHNCDLLKYLCSRYPYWIDYGSDPAAAKVDTEPEEPVDPALAFHQASLEESARMVEEWKREQLGQTSAPWSRSSGWSF